MQNLYQGGTLCRLHWILRSSGHSILKNRILKCVWGWERHMTIWGSCLPRWFGQCGEEVLTNVSWGAEKNYPLIQHAGGHHIWLGKMIALSDCIGRFREDVKHHQYLVDTSIDKELLLEGDSQCEPATRVTSDEGENNKDGFSWEKIIVGIPTPLPLCLILPPQLGPKPATNLVYDSGLRYSKPGPPKSRPNLRLAGQAEPTHH
ncbi:hypothetical protein BDZ94DRAFT_1295262 [Collybia nuda]|uniref:Uncharacterized protein n=1 Tax=Collybia nuda TaxID=64659 RepID=A0A9P5YBX4_9AGAR|nr:hypothetical protein BDZ94DRAFT_1295262 [Collybia nuda]